MATENTAIPIVDFGAWPKGTPGERQRIATELTDACRSVGFAYVVNHGVPEEELAECFAWSKRLFDLPQDQKMLAPHPPGPSVHRGYSWPGLEKVSNHVRREGQDSSGLEQELRKVQDCKESYEIGSEANADQPNVWLPEDVLPGFRAFTRAFYWRCFGAARELLRALALGVGLGDEDYLLRFHSGHNGQLRLLHYPPVPAEDLSSGAVERMPAHTDFGSITLLFQDACGGLQVENPWRPGTFINAAPVGGALIMNIGDLLMRWSNDFLKSNQHRVTLPPLSAETGLTRARYSIPFFLSPDPDSIIECLPACADEKNPAKYAPVSQREYRMSRAALQYREEPAKPNTRQLNGGLVLP